MSTKGPLSVGPFFVSINVQIIFNGMGNPIIYIIFKNSLKLCNLFNAPLYPHSFALYAYGADHMPGTTF
jgi:hypothetical protein